MGAILWGNKNGILIRNPVLGENGTKHPANVLFRRRANRAVRDLRGIKRVGLTVRRVSMKSGILPPVRRLLTSVPKSRRLPMAYASVPCWAKPLGRWKKAKNIGYAKHVCRIESPIRRDAVLLWGESGIPRIRVAGRRSIHTTNRVPISAVIRV